MSNPASIVEPALIHQPCAVDSLNSNLLVRHPKPNPTESVLGYLLRLSEQNGYRCPSRVRQLAGIPPHQSVGRSVYLAKLVAILNYSQSEIESIMNPDGASPSVLSGFPDLPFLPSQEGIANAKCCPQCIAEKGSIEAHWTMPQMIACPIHRLLAVSSCPGCKKPLRWYRRGLLECSCGTKVSITYHVPVTNGEASLLDVVRRKVLCLPASEENPEGFPLRDLMNMDLPLLLSVIQSLAKYQCVTDHCDSPGDQRQIIYIASRTLKDWPTNFIQFLKKSSRRFSRATSYSIQKHVEGIYAGLFGNRTISNQSQTDFLEIIIVEFALKAWGYSDPAILQRFEDRLPTGFLEQMKPAVATAARIRNEGHIPDGIRSSNQGSKWVKSNEKEPDARDHRSTHESRGKVLSTKIAAMQPGLPEPVFLALKTSGVYEINQTPPEVSIARNSTSWLLSGG